jgi:hypothetical protein
MKSYMASADFLASKKSKTYISRSGQNGRKKKYITKEILLVGSA